MCSITQTLFTGVERVVSKKKTFTIIKSSINFRVCSVCETLRYDNFQCKINLWKEMGTT